MSNEYTLNNILYNIINDDDTFNLSYYENKKELDILKKWYELINKDYYIKETEIKLVNPEEVIKIYPNSISLNLIEKVNEEIKVINEYHELGKKVEKIKLKYNNINNNIISSDKEILKEKNLMNCLWDGKETINKRLDKLKNNETTLDYDLEAYNEYEEDYFLKNINNYSYIEEKTIENENNKVLIIYHKEEMSPLILKDYSNLEETLAKKNSFGFEFIDLLKLNNNMYEILTKSINDKLFNNKEELKEFINITIKINKSDNLSEQEKVIDYFKNYLIKDDNIENKVKFTTLATKIEEHLNINNDIKFRHRLSKYLINFGFKKKRFSDGFYYYGITFKKLITDYSILDIEKIIKLREEEINNLNNNK
jgi:hypothetical protein